MEEVIAIMRENNVVEWTEWLMEDYKRICSGDFSQWSHYFMAFGAGGVTDGIASADGNPLPEGVYKKLHRLFYLIRGPLTEI